MKRRAGRYLLTLMQCTDAVSASAARPDLARVGPTSMRKPLSRPERDDCGTSQTSIRRHPPWWSAMRGYAVAPIQYRGVAMRHVGPRDAAWVPLPISTWTASSPSCLCAGPGPSGDSRTKCNNRMTNYEQLFGRYRERLAGGAGGGNERPCSPARCRRNPDRMFLRRCPDFGRHRWITSSLGLRGPVGTRAVRART